MNSLDIRLEKTEYLAGEEANGEIIISVERVSEFKNFKFYVQGKEDPLKSIPDYLEEGRVISRGDTYDYSPPSEKASNIFFFKDLLDSFNNNTGIKISNDGTLEFEKGQWKIPFHFTISADSLEAYDGRNVSVTYEVAAKVSAFQFDHLNNVQAFTVLNPNYTQEVHGKTIFLFNKPIILDWKEQEQGIRGVKVRLSLDDDKYSFSPGETVRGRVTVSSDNVDDRKAPKIKKAEITLSQVEDSIKLTDTANRDQIYKQQISRNQIEENVDRSVIFEIPLSEGYRRKRNYVGKLTAYYWLLEAKLDMGLTHHFHRSTIIEVF